MPAERNTHISNHRRARRPAAYSRPRHDENQFPSDHPFTTPRLRRRQSRRMTLGDTVNTLFLDTCGDDQEEVSVQATPSPVLTPGLTTPQEGAEMTAGGPGPLRVDRAAQTTAESATA